MKKGYLLIFLILPMHAQQHDKRVVGVLVTVKDRATWRKINNISDVQGQELVAAYSVREQDWLYAEVIIAPDSNFSGLACFVKDGLYYNYFAVDFKKNVRKLLTKEEISVHDQRKESESCTMN